MHGNSKKNSVPLRKGRQKGGKTVNKNCKKKGKQKVENGKIKVTKR